MLNASPALFEANYESVTGGEVSLKSLLLESGKSKMILKTKSMIAMEANYESFENLQLQYPEKLSNDVVLLFIGAQTMGKNKNMKGLMLLNYVSNIKKQKREEIQLTHLDEKMMLKSVTVGTVIINEGEGVRVTSEKVSDDNAVALLE